MTRTDADAKSMKRDPAHRGSASLSRLLALPLALVLVAAFAASALAAAEPATTGYSHATTPKQEVLPSKSKTTPQKEPTPSKTSTTPATSTEPTATTAPTKASSLPFTGLNLSWVVGFGLLLIVAGGSIVMVQRRQRDSGRR
jgi:cytoskeletal protein RodZ